MNKYQSCSGTSGAGLLMPRQGTSGSAPSALTDTARSCSFCQKIHLCSVLQPFMGGYAIRFPRSKYGDVVQHYGSYGAFGGCVEPAIRRFCAWD